jgi:SAM-dependent methyltransferase
MPSSHINDILSQYKWLLSDEGVSLLLTVQDRLAAGETVLRVSEKLRRDHDAGFVALAITQTQLRAQGVTKFTDADRLFFTREGLEQATSDRIARHRSERFAAFDHIVDLCCGIGGDLMALASLPGERRLTAVDLDPIHLLLARHNVRVIAPDHQLEIVQEDVRNIGLTPVDAVFIDPARRNERGRMGGVESEPPVDWAIGLADRVAAVGIKTAPGLPHELVPDGWEMETIAIDADLKEAVLWSPALATSLRSATVITGDVVHRLMPLEGDAVEIREPESGGWLLDPNPAITRAGLVEDLARRVDAFKIDDEIGFLVADHGVDTPFARALRIVDSLPWHEKQVKVRLRELDAGPVDVRRRGLAGDVDAISKRLRGKGSRRMMIAMTRYQGEPWAIICDLV